tara:strand:+ start:67 stop:876 length:810 start_codon:yes stop_codon:yes gene_type:complete
MVAESAVNERIGELVYLFKKEGFSDKEAAAMLGNIDVETGGSFDYLQKQYKGGPGRGLFQFEGLKLNAYNEWLKANNKKNSAQSQIQYVKQSIKSPETLPKSIMNLPAMKNAESVSDIVGSGNAKNIRKIFKEGNVKEASDIFADKYEKPKSKSSYGKRRASAQNFYNQLTGAPEFEVEQPPTLAKKEKEIEVEVAEVEQPKSFKQAFAEARGNKDAEFTYSGSKYNTKLKGETPQQYAAFLQKDMPVRVARKGGAIESNPYKRQPRFI